MTKGNSTCSKEILGKSLSSASGSLVPSPSPGKRRSIEYIPRVYAFVKEYMYL